MGPLLPTVLTCLKTHPLLVPCLPHLTFLLSVSGDHSINYQHTDPCARICFWGKPTRALSPAVLPSSGTYLQIVFWTTWARNKLDIQSYAYVSLQPAHFPVFSVSLGTHAISPSHTRQRCGPYSTISSRYHQQIITELLVEKLLCADPPAVTVFA